MKKNQRKKNCSEALTNGNKTEPNGQYNVSFSSNNLLIRAVLSENLNEFI